MFPPTLKLIFVFQIIQMSEAEAGDVRGRRTEVKEKLPFPMNPNHRRQVKFSQSLSLFNL